MAFDFTKIQIYDMAIKAPDVDIDKINVDLQLSASKAIINKTFGLKNATQHQIKDTAKLISHAINSDLKRIFDKDLTTSSAFYQKALEELNKTENSNMYITDSGLVQMRTDFRKKTSSSVSNLYSLMSQQYSILKKIKTPGGPVTEAQERAQKRLEGLIREFSDNPEFQKQLEDMSMRDIDKIYQYAREAHLIGHDSYTSAGRVKASLPDLVGRSKVQIKNFYNRINEMSTERGKVAAKGTKEEQVTIENEVLHKLAKMDHKQFMQMAKHKESTKKWFKKNNFAY